jgi:hypothetical protein
MSTARQRREEEVARALLGRGASGRHLQGHGGWATTRLRGTRLDDDGGGGGSNASSADVASGVEGEGSGRRRAQSMVEPGTLRLAGVLAAPPARSAPRPSSQLTLRTAALPVADKERQKSPTQAALPPRGEGKRAATASSFTLRLQPAGLEPEPEPEPEPELRTRRAAAEVPRGVRAGDESPMLPELLAMEMTLRIASSPPQVRQPAMHPAPAIAKEADEDDEEDDEEVEEEEDEEEEDEEGEEADESSSETESDTEALRQPAPQPEPEAASDAETATDRVAVGVETAGVRWSTATTATQQLAVMTPESLALADARAHSSSSDSGSDAEDASGGSAGGLRGTPGVRTAALPWLSPQRPMLAGDESPSIASIQVHTQY